MMISKGGYQMIANIFVVHNRDLPKNMFNNGVNVDQIPKTYRKIYFSNIATLMTVKLSINDMCW